MITINDNRRYWSVGITLTYTPFAGRDSNGVAHPGWHVSLDFCDDGFADDDTDTGRIATEGKLHTRYAVRDGETRSGLSAAIDTLIEDAVRLGVEFTKRFLYYRGDGEHSDYPPPVGWRQLLAAEAERIGWATYTTTKAAAS